MPLQQMAFWKHSDKRRICSKQAISRFATMFSTFSHRLSIQLKRFPTFWQNMFKVVGCKISRMRERVKNSDRTITRVKIPVEARFIYTFCSSTRGSVPQTLFNRKLAAFVHLLHWLFVRVILRKQSWILNSFNLK